MRSNLACILACIAICVGCNNPLVLWERATTLTGSVRSQDRPSVIGNVLPNAHVRSSTAYFEAVTDSHGVWSVSVESMSVPAELRYTCPGYDSAFTTVRSMETGRTTMVPTIWMAHTVADTALSFSIHVDSIHTDTIWFRVNAIVPDSLFGLTVCFYDTLETNQATVKKWSIELGTAVSLQRSECTGKPLMRSGVFFVDSMAQRNKLVATAALGIPTVYRTSSSADGNESVRSVGGLGPLVAWRTNIGP